jgi:hypothetical protein
MVPEHERLNQAQAQGGIKAFLDARDGPFYPGAVWPARKVQK